jgi:signal transduction histidine kinase
MTNAARHSGASSLSVIVSERASAQNRAVHAIIEDNGTGFDVERTRRAGGSVGLHSMSERSELLNGTVEIESSEEGTTLYVQIPIQEEQTA